MSCRQSGLLGSQVCWAVWPVQPHDPEPFAEALPEIPFAGVFADPELIGEAEFAEERRQFPALRLMAPRAQPHVEIETARNIGELTEHPGVDRYRMRLNLLPECLTKADHIPVGLRIRKVLISRSTAPDP